MLNQWTYALDSQLILPPTLLVSLPLLVTAVPLVFADFSHTLQQTQIWDITYFLPSLTKMQMSLGLLCFGHWWIPRNGLGTKKVIDKLIGVNFRKIDQEAKLLRKRVETHSPLPFHMDCFLASSPLRNCRVHIAAALSCTEDTVLSLSSLTPDFYNLSSPSSVIYPEPRRKGVWWQSTL